MRARRFANAVLITAAGFFALLLVYLLAKGAPDTYPLATRVFVACVLVFLIVSLRGPVRYKVNCSLAIMSLGGSLLLAQMALSFISFYTPPVLSGPSVDTRPIHQVIKDLGDAGFDAHPVMTLGIFRNRNLGELNVGGVVPLGSIANTTSILCNELGYFLIYESDEHGFHNPQGIWGQERIDIVTIGDSFVHGVCVHSEENPTALIRNVYPNTLNLGSAGTGPLTHLAIIKEYLPELKPRRVLWFYWEGDDLSNQTDEYNLLPTLRRYLEANYRQDLASKQGIIDEGLRLIADRELTFPREAPPPRERRSVRIVRETITLYELRLRLLTAIRHLRGCEVIPGEPLRLFDRILRDANDLVSSWGGELYFVYLPDWERYTRFAISFEQQRVGYKCYDQVMSIANDIGLPVIDVAKAFEAHPDPHSLWPNGGIVHYDEEGYALVAKTVLQALEVEN